MIILPSGGIVRGTIPDVVWRVMPLLGILGLVPTFAQRGRYMPPPAVQCDRNQLTSYTGEVTRYTRQAGKISMKLKTDEQIVQAVSLRPDDKLLLNAREMQKDDWKLVEVREGKLRPGMRATVWFCRGGRPVLDWQPPQH